ncbi:MAG TPA: potassium-transporting ATPase subunit C [Thermoplasmata archaeon]|nr:potassium-transporting ATPase subunit C [Thermoplasmata archaeon]
MANGLPRVPTHRSAPPGRPSGWAPALRASLTFLTLLVLLGGAAYPYALSEVGATLTPGTSEGSLALYPNGTAFGSALLAENITSPALFWARASLIGDAPLAGAGGEVPPGPTDPALLNETRYFVGLYGLNGSPVPIDLVGPSASGLDPDLTPGAVLVQIPRVAHFGHLSEEWLRGFVNARIVYPIAGFIGPAYVNVVALDVALLPYLPSGSTYTSVPP